MSGRKSYLFCFGIVMALAASMGVAHAVTCTPVGSTVTCTGGPAAHVSVANGFAAFTTIAATTYPTTINVTGGSGTVSSLTLTLHGYTSMSGAGFNSSRNVGLLLVSPNGHNLQIMRADGAATCTVAAGAPDITHCQSNLTFTIQDGAAAFPDPLATSPNNQWFSGGTFKPTAYPSGGTGPASPNYTVSGGPAMVNSAAPNGAATLASVFAGDTVNGNWSLYLVDDNNNKADVQFASWDIAITFSNATTPSTTTLAPNPTNPFTGANVLLSAQVTNTATGTVTFKDNGVNVTCAEGPQPEALNGSSVAVCTTTFSTEGIHPLTANYSGDGTFVSSIGSANVFVQNHACNGASCAPVVATTTYCNTGTVTNDGHSDLGYAHTSPYPSAIIVGDGTNADITQAVSTLSVTLKGFTSSNSSQVRMLLVAPDGTHAYDFWSNAGGGAAGTGDYTIIDGATQLSTGSPLSPGTYGPAGYGILPDPFTPGPPAPAPQIPGSFSYASPMGNPNSKTFFSAFTGTGAHGTWSLFLHNAGGAGTSTSFATGWCLAITPATGHPTTTGVMANPTNANLGAPVIFTATVASSGQPTPNQGTVTFTENGGPLTGAPNGGVANVANGVAIIVTSGLPEGDHIVNAQYHDSTNFYSDSIGSVNMRVDKATSTPTLNGSTWSYCNTGAITIPAGTVVSNDFGPATPNPSNIFVTNLPGTISSIGVTLKQFHDLQPGNLESLLVGPNGLSAPTTAQTLDFFTRAGGVNAYGPADLSFFDGFTAAPNVNPLAATNGPASYGATPTYTPSLFYTLPGTFQRATTAGAFTFNTGTYTPNVGGGVYKNTLPNGTWSLYFDQLINDTGSGANNGWCVAFTENPVTVTATKGHTGRPPNGNFQQGHPGASFSFNIKNNGDANGLGSTGDPDGAHPLKVVDVLDASAFTPGTLPTGTPWNCTAVTNTVTCTSSLSIASGSFYPVLTIPVNVLNNAPASATNQGSLSGGGITATTSTIEPVTIDPAPVLAITKAHSGTFTQGQTGTWTLQVANNSATAAGNTDGTTVTVTDTLPTGYTGWSGSGTGWTCVTNTLVVSCTSNAAINGNGGMFPLITLTGTVPAASPTSVSNSATVFGGGDVVHTNLGSAAVSNTDTVTVIQVPAFVNINGSATQSTPINTAFGSLAVTVQDAGHVTIPNYMSVVFTAPGSGASGTFDNATNTKSVTTGSGGSAGVADPGVFTANGIAGAYSMDVLAGTIHATFNLTNTAPDLTIAKSHSGNFSQGQQGAQFSLVVTNGGGATTGANTITVTDTLPSGLTFASGTGTGWSCMANGQAVTCTDAGTPIAANGTSTITLNVNVAANAPGTVSNTATVACACTESNTNNNTSNTDMVTVSALADLTVSKGHNPSNFAVNDVNDTFTITVANGGSAASSGTVTVTDTLPTGLTFNGSPTAGWSCGAVNQVVTCTTMNAIASSGTSSVVINVNVASSTASPLTNTVSVACSCAESNTNNNTGSDMVTVLQVVNITLNTSPTGLLVSADGGPFFTAPHVYQFLPNSTHSIATTSPQTNGSTQYVWLNWSDGMAISHNINTPSSPTTYTANFKTQYLLTTQVSPSLAAGSISPASFVDAGTVVSVSATANTGYAFTGFTGALTGTTNPQNLTVNAPSTVTANFMALPDLTITKSHPGGAGGHFSQGQLGATYSIMVGNNGPGASSGTVTMTDTIPSGLTMVSMSGTGWTCGPPNANNVCTRTDSVGSGGTYQPITVTVNVDAAAPATVTNMATVSGNGDYNLSNNTAMDPTTINPITNVSGSVSVTQTGFGRNRATGIWSATMTVTNSSGVPISGPIQVVLTNLTPGVTMVNNTGTRNGSPYITVSAGTLAAGAAVNVTIQFQNPSNGFINYTPVTDSGTF